MKKCIKCNIKLVVGENWLKCQVNNYSYICKECRRKNNKPNKNIRKIQYRNDIKLCRKCNEELLVGDNWLETFVKNNDYICNKCKSKYGTLHYNKNKSDKCKYQKEYYNIHKEKIFYQRNDYERKRRKTDPNFKLRKLLRSRLRNTLKGNYRTGSAVRDLGCTIDELKVYLESKFQEGMTWENHGTIWHIDHIEPLCSFDLTHHEQLLAAIHFTNLRPIFKEENLSKISYDKKKSVKIR